MIQAEIIFKKPHNQKNVYFFVYAVFFGPKFSMNLEFAWSILKFDDLNSQHKASHTHDIRFSSCRCQPSDKLIPVNLLPGRFSRRVPQAARLGLFPSLLYRLLSFLYNLRAK